MSMDTATLVGLWAVFLAGGYVALTGKAPPMARIGVAIAAAAVGKNLLEMQQA